MTETEWKLRKELAELKQAFAQSQYMLLQHELTKAKAESDTLGEKWVDPDGSIEEVSENS